MELQLVQGEKTCMYLGFKGLDKGDSSSRVNRKWQEIIQMYWRDLEHGAVGWMVICRAWLPADISPILLQVTCDLPVLTALPRQSLWGLCGNVPGLWLSLPGELLDENWSDMMERKQSRADSISVLFPSLVLTDAAVDISSSRSLAAKWNRRTLPFRFGVYWIDAPGSQTLMSHWPCCGVLSITPHVSFFQSILHYVPQPILLKSRSAGVRFGFFCRSYRAQWITYTQVPLMTPSPTDMHHLSVLHNITYYKVTFP